MDGRCCCRGKDDDGFAGAFEEDSRFGVDDEYGMERPLPRESFLGCPFARKGGLLKDGEPGTPAAPQAAGGGDGGTIIDAALKSRVAVLQFRWPDA